MRRRLSPLGVLGFSLAAWLIAALAYDLAALLAEAFAPGWLFP